MGAVRDCKTFSRSRWRFFKLKFVGTAPRKVFGAQHALCSRSDAGFGMPICVRATRLEEFVCVAARPDLRDTHAGRSGLRSMHRTALTRTGKLDVYRHPLAHEIILSEHRCNTWRSVRNRR